VREFRPEWRVFWFAKFGINRENLTGCPLRRVKDVKVSDRVAKPKVGHPRLFIPEDITLTA
jgi:hypothetical protein